MSTKFNLELHGDLKDYKLDPEVRRDIFRRICETRYNLLRNRHVDDDSLLDFCHDSYRLNLHYAAIRSKNPSRQAYYVAKAERFNEKAKILEDQMFNHCTGTQTGYEFSPISVTRSDNGH